MTMELTFGQWLRRRRKTLDLTQAELARRVGCAKVTLQKIELEERRPSHEIAMRLAQVLDVSPAEHDAFVRIARSELVPAWLADPQGRPDIAAPRSQPTIMLNHLPAPTTPLVGRAHEVAFAHALLRQPTPRLITFTGMGGTGKTRVALEVARVGAADFRHGVRFVALAAISDPALVGTTIGQALGLTEQGGQPIEVLLQSLLHDKQLLLVLDNFEQILAAAPLVAKLLAAAPQLKVLVTSRAPLHLTGEQQCPVLPLAVPAVAQHQTADFLMQYPAVELFVQRVQAVRPDFRLTDATGRTVAEICVRLDGLPLAIELVAPRIKLLGLGTLLTQLQGRLTVLTGGARDLPARQQTLRATIAWSYDLLEPHDQILFTRLAVFAGGCTLHAAEAVCAAAGDAPLVVGDGLGRLIDHSLVQQDIGARGELRFRMLETIREYAVELLAGSDEAEQLWQRHADYYVALVEAAEWELGGSKLHVWLGRLDAERDNLRAVLHWSLAHGEVELGLRMVGAIWPFWWLLGYMRELRQWLRAALGLSRAVQPSVRVKVLSGAGVLANDQGDTANAQALLEESLALAQELADQRGTAATLRWLGDVAIRRSQLVQAGMHYSESLAVARSAQDMPNTARALQGLGDVAAGQGNYHQAVTDYEEALTLHRALENKEGMAAVLHELGRVAEQRQSYPEARRLYQQSLMLNRDLGNKQGLGRTTITLAWITAQHGHAAEAQGIFQESLDLCREQGDRRGMVDALDGLAYLAGRRGDYGAAQSLYRESLAISKELGNKQAIAGTLNSLGYLAGLCGEYAAAVGPLEESIALSRELEDKHILVAALHSLALAVIFAQDESRARALLGEGLSVVQSFGNKRQLAGYLEGFGALATVEEQPARAARLFGAAKALRDGIGVPQSPAEGDFLERYVAATHTDIDEAAWEAAWREGQAMTLEQAIAYALGSS